MPPAESIGAAALPTAQADGAAGRMLAHLRTPIHRDGYALVLNSAFTAVTGLVYWIVAANQYSAVPHQAKAHPIGSAQWAKALWPSPSSSSGNA